MTSLKRREYLKRWREKNKDKLARYYNTYVSKPGIREKRTASAERWKKENPEKFKAYRKEYRARPKVKDRRYELYRKKLGPGHRQSVKNFLRLESKKIARRQSVMKCYNTRKEYLWAYKAERGCKICGEKDPICLDFHHRDKATKNPKLIRDNGKNNKGSWFFMSTEAVLVELAKVDVLCSNCHRKTHRDERNASGGIG